MITITIYINGSPIISRSASRMLHPDGLDPQIELYKQDDGKIIKHRPDEGAVKLAIKMLKKVKEIK